MKRTSSLEIKFWRGSLVGLSVQVFADAEYEGKAASGRRSVSAELVMCDAGCVSWFDERRNSDHFV